MEFFDLIVFSYVCFYDTRRIDIFLHDIVQNVVLIKHSDKMRVRFLCDKDQRAAEKRNDNEEQ